MITEFSSFTDGPGLHDWVLCDRDPGRPEINDYIKNNMGVIMNIDANFYKKEKYYIVKFYDIPKNIIDFFYFVGITKGKWEGCIDVRVKDIIYWSKDKEDVEERINANKYNL